MLSNYNIKTVSLPPRKILSPSIYSILCVRHKVYIGQTGSSIKTRIKERKELTTTIREVSSGKHNNDLSYRILFDNTGILAGKHWCMELLIREPADIELNPNNVNWEDGFSLHIPLKPFFHPLKEKKAAGDLRGQKSLTLTPITTHTSPICASPKHGPWKGWFTSSALTSFHLYIPHCWPLRGPFLELTPIGSYQPYPSRPPIALIGYISPKYPHNHNIPFPPNHFIIQLNHIVTLKIGAIHTSKMLENIYHTVQKSKRGQNDQRPPWKPGNLQHYNWQQMEELLEQLRYWRVPEITGYVRRKRLVLYEGWNFNSGNYLFTTDTK